jgi:hypothetical protein
MTPQLFNGDWNVTIAIQWWQKCHRGCPMAMKLKYSTLVVMEAFYLFIFPFFFFLFLKGERGIVSQNLVNDLNMWKSPTIMFRGSSKINLKKHSWITCTNFYINLWGNTTILLFTKMWIFAFLTKLCTSIMDFILIYGHIVLK